MSIGLNANNDGSGSVQTGGTDAIVISATQNVSIPNNLTAPTIKSASTNTPPTFQDSAGTQVGTLCRAWVNFNGVTTATIRASFNVSSVTRNSAGDYTVNFTNSISDANYASVFGTYQDPLPTAAIINIKATPTTTALNVGVYRADTRASSDNSYVNVSVFR